MKWRVPQDFRLVDFHKPLLQQAPVIFFVLAMFVTLMIVLGIIGYERMN